MLTFTLQVAGQVVKVECVTISPNFGLWQHGIPLLLQLYSCLQMLTLSCREMLLEAHTRLAEAEWCVEEAKGA